MDPNALKSKAVAAVGAATLLAGSREALAQSNEALTLPPAPMRRIEQRTTPPQLFQHTGATFPEQWQEAQAAKSPVKPREAAPLIPPPENKDDFARKGVVSGLSVLLALGGYALSIHRGTPKDKRQDSLLTRACESLFPETPYFPNNKATWLMSTLNSSSLFLLGVLKAVQSGQSAASSLLSMAIVGVYAAGAGWLCKNAYKHGSEFKMHPTDKKCLIGGSIGLGIFIYSGLARLGYLPAVDAPLELIGIGVGLLTRGFALFPLMREFKACVKHARAMREASTTEERKERKLPSLGAQIFWNAAIGLNLLNLPKFFSVASIVPLGMTLQNMVLFGTGIWAYCQVHKGADSAQKPAK